MKFLLVLSCVLAVALGAALEKKTQPCKTPTLTGEFKLFTPAEEVWANGDYFYDASQQRMRVFQFGQFGNETIFSDDLLLIHEGVQYKIDYGTQTCTKTPLAKDSQPIGIPTGSTFKTSAVIGSSSGPKQGLLINTWTKALPIGELRVTVTQFGCIPVFTSFHLKEGSKGLGQFALSYYNAVKGIVDPNILNLPPFCSDEKNVQEEKKPVDFFSVFQNFVKKPNVV